MSKKKQRTPKKGVVYLLISSCGSNLKFGASQVSARSRIKWANKVYKQKFKILIEYESDDIFRSENDFRWWLASNHQYFGFEIFPNSLDIEIVKSALLERCVRL